MTEGRPSRRIVFVIGSLTRGGAETQMLLLAEQLVSRGWKATVFVLEKDGELIEKFCRAGVSIVDGGYRSRARSRPYKIALLLYAHLKLVAHLAASRAHVVHGFLPLTNFLAAVAGRMTLRPVVVTSKRGLGTHQDRSSITRLLDRTSNRLSHVVTANSPAVAEDCSRRDGYPIDRIVVIPNGLDFSTYGHANDRRAQVRKELGFAETDIAIVNVANLIPYKGHHELIEAFAALSKQDDRLRLVLIGDDRGILPTLRRQAESLGVEETVRFLGQRDDVAALLAVMDVGVMASHEEGFSNALLEKLATGLPVVATRVGGNPKALEGMPGCVLVEPRDAKSLADGLSSVLGRLPYDAEARTVRKELIQSKYSVCSMVDAYEEIYSNHL